MKEIELCILGAGPAGAATALKLSYMGIPSVLIDRSTFPRDKVCGDAISGKVTTLLNRLDPAILKRFESECSPQPVWGVRFFAPNGKMLEVPYDEEKLKTNKSAPGFISRRIDFDNFLLREVKKRTNIEVVEGTDIRNITRTERGYRLSDASDENSWNTRLLIVANGAHSSFSRNEGGLKMDPLHHSAAVRAYYKNITGLSGKSFIEMHFLRSISPGYFWIFPLPNGESNVGLGLPTYVSKRKKIGLKKLFYETIENSEHLRERFNDAEAIGPLEGYDLPLGSKKRKLSGDHFILTGDAAHLIDPFTGEGIGNSFYSGFIAAEVASDCLDKNNFTSTFLEAYDKRISTVLGSEFNLSHKLQRLIRHKRLANFLVGILRSNKKMISLITKMFTDLDLRAMLIRPKFWMKMYFRRNIID